MRVELDIFSGCASNPSWELSPAECDEFMERLRNLPPGDEAEDSQDGLGYRGLVVTEASETFTAVTIANGVVSCEGPQGNLCCADAGRQLERWLIDTGKAHMDAEVCEQVEQCLEAD